MFNTIDEEKMRYLKIISKEYPNIASAATEIINLQAILNLPKGTEHFITDLHGEYEQFTHVLKNASGAIRRKIDDEFGDSLSPDEKRSLATLIYYPELKIEDILKKEQDIVNWYKVTLHRLIKMCKGASSKYTRSKVRKAMPEEFRYIMEELLSGRDTMSDQEAYYSEIISAIIETDRAKELIISFCDLIRRFVVDHLHVVGDIFDRGPRPHDIMETLINHHSVDIQWGNHDALWMGAAVGETCCMANLLRISAKYGNLDILEDGYGINMLPLAKLAMEVYADDPCDCFKLGYNEADYKPEDVAFDRRMHKAIAIIQFKLEGQKMRAHPEFDMDERLIMHTMDLEKKTVVVEGVEYPLRDTYFPTIKDPKNAYELTKEEAEVVDHLRDCFVNCEKLQRHIRFLYAKGSMYKVYNGNLLYHGCVPLNDDGTFKKVNIYGREYSGKALYDALEKYARKGFFSRDPKDKERGRDIMWFIWENKNSPVFGKAKMTTFERYFIEDKSTHKEPKNPYYKYLENEAVVESILKEFGLDPKEGHIINGHVPVEQKKGESPIKCGGKLLIIDGGFSKAYQGKTGIAGYTLIYNSYGLVLAAHEPFESIDKAVKDESDIHSQKILVEHVLKRKRVADTDTGRELKDNIEGLKLLLEAYRTGQLVERH